MWEGQWVPIVFFFLFLLPPVSVGFFKGWRTALFTTVVTFALTGIFVGIGLATYDKFIWPMFKSFFVKSVVDSHMAINSLKELSKPTAITIVIGILVLPIYGITFLIYWPLRGWLENHLWPKTSDVDQNTKTYSYRRNLKSRLSGLSISLTSSLLMASMATTASAAFFSRSDSKHKSLSSFTGALTSVYTFGQGGYDDSFFELREFLDEDFKNKQMEQFKNIMYIPQSGTINAAEINKLDVQPFKSKLVHLLQNARTSEALANLVIDSAHFSPITLLDNSYGGSASVDFRDAITNQNIESVIAGIHLNLHISADVKAKMEHVIETKVIAGFEKTGYARELADVQKTMQTIRGQIAKRKQASLDARHTADSLAAQITKAKQEKASIERRLSELGDSTSGLISAQETKVKNAHDDTVAKKGILDSYQSTFVPAESALKTAEQAMKNVVDEINSTKGLIEAEKSKIFVIEKDIREDDLKIQQLTNQVNLASSQKSALESRKRGSESKRAAERAKPTPDLELIKMLDQQIQNIDGEIAQKNTDISNLNNNIQVVRNAKATSQTELSDSQSELNRLNGLIRTKEGEKQIRQNALDAAKSNFTPIDAENKKRNAAWNQAANVEQRENGVLQRYVAEKARKEDELTKVEANLVSWRQTILARINEWNVLNNKNSITGPTDVFVEGTDNTGSPLVGSIKEKEVELQNKKDDPTHGETFLIKQKNDKYKEWLEIKGKYLQLIDKLLSV